MRKQIGFLQLFAIWGILLLLVGRSASAEPAMAMGYTPKYPPDFTHFDYVNPAASRKGAVVLSAFGTFDSLNPYTLKGIPASGLSLLVFESLLEKSLDEPFSVYALLAEDFELAEDGLSVTFRLNPKARFSNGRKVTAQDVKFSFDTLMSQAAHPQFRFYYGDAKEAVVLDERTVRFDFHRVNPELHLILGDIPVFSREWLGDQPFDKVTETVPISSGPYVVDRWENGKHIRFRRNPDYWARDLPVRKGMFNFEQVTYKYYKDTTVALEAFKSGEFDFFFENHAKRWARDHVGPRYARGDILKEELHHQNNAGMQGFVFNTRRDLFKDRRVRRALALAFDFEWSNRQLFYQQYVRNYSYFSNSELASSGLPEGEELALLESFRDQLPAEIFTEEWRPSSTAEPSSLRHNLRQAKALLKEAGWAVSNGVLENARGQPFEFDILLVQKGFERIVAPYARNLQRLGIKVNYRTVDASLYQRRVDSFDFDMVVTSYGQSQSPGNELKSMFHSEAADQPGSRNLPGISDPVVDALIDRVISSPNRQQLIVAVRALDRVLLHGEYLVPNWYIDTHRIAYRNKFDRPRTLPLYYEPVSWMLKTWWIK